MAIITKAELRNAASTVNLALRTEMFSRRDRLYEANRQNGVTVFLSHSHTDQDVIQEAVTLLSKEGVYVYVDWMDASMPARTSGETAKQLKEKIKSCDKFVLLASPQAIKSNWVNWELGYGDSHKFLENLALFPVLESTYHGWTEAEYLQIYPYIEKLGAYESAYYVVFPDGRKMLLKDWLKRKLI